MSNETEEVLEKVKKKSDDTYAMLSNLCLSHEIVKDKLDDIAYDLCTKISLAQHQETNGKVESAFEAIKNEIRALVVHKDTIYAKMRLIESEIKELKNVLREVLCDQYDLKKLITEVDKKLAPAITNVHKKISEVKNEFNEKINQIVIPQDKVNIDQVKSQIAFQTEATRRDATTSIVTTTDHGHRLNTIEKKLEGVLIQMKSNGLYQ